MKKLLSLKSVLICIAFAVFLLLVKDNLNMLWDILSLFAKVLSPFIIGFLFAYILNFPYKFFYLKAFKKMGTKRKICGNFRKPLSIVCTYTILLAIIGFLIAILTPQIAENISSLVTSMPQYYESFLSYMNNSTKWLNDTFAMGINMNDIASFLGNKVTSFFSGDNLTKLTGEATDWMWTFVTSTADGVYNFVMGLVISVYFLSAKENLCKQVKKLAVAYIPIKYLPKIYEIVDITDTKCGRFLVGDIIDAAFVGLLTFITMSIFGLPYSPLIAVIIGITNIIPFFGPFIGAIPSAFILLLINPWDMIIFVIINIVIQQLDGNLFKPKIIGSQVGLSSFWVLFSVIVGGALFGIIGLILGTPIYAVIYSLVGKNARNRIKDKGHIANEALDFEVLNYTKIAAEQKKLREEQETKNREKIMNFIKHKEDGAKSNTKGDDKFHFEDIDIINKLSKSSKEKKSDSSKDKDEENKTDKK